MISRTLLAEKLRARLRELEGRADDIEEDLRHPLEADSSEQAIDLADDEALAGVDDVLRRDIAQIRAALARIKNGTYGSCVICGQDIDPARLEALPTATRCISCA
jgi:RNA polymerase-binding transcription factor